MKNQGIAFLSQKALDFESVNHHGYITFNWGPLLVPVKKQTRNQTENKGKTLMKTKKTIGDYTFESFIALPKTQKFLKQLSYKVFETSSFFIEQDDAFQELSFGMFVIWDYKVFEGSEKNNIGYLKGFIKNFARGLASNGYISIPKDHIDSEMARSPYSKNNTDYMSDAESISKNALLVCHSSQDVDLSCRHNGKYFIQGNAPESRQLARDIFQKASQVISNWRKDDPAKINPTELKRRAIIETIFDPSEEFIQFMRHSGGTYINSARLEICSKEEISTFLDVSWGTVCNTIQDFKVTLGLHGE